jgi:pyruvate formate lyase activating enzyme
MNDAPEELEARATFIYRDLGPETPWHLSRFYPQYKMTDRAPTEEKILRETKIMAESIGLAYVYIGNVYGRDSTQCKVCDQVLISRSGYSVNMVGINQEGHCKNCGTTLDGVGLSCNK